MQQLATAANVTKAVVEKFEADGVVLPAAVGAMLEALQGAGLEFIPAGGKSMDGGPGLRTIPIPEPEVEAAQEVVELELEERFPPATA